MYWTLRQPDEGVSHRMRFVHSFDPQMLPGNGLPLPAAVSYGSSSGRRTSESGPGEREEITICNVNKDVAIDCERRINNEQ